MIVTQISHFITEMKGVKYRSIDFCVRNHENIPLYLKFTLDESTKDDVLRSGLDRFEDSTHEIFLRLIAIPFGFPNNFSDWFICNSDTMHCLLEKLESDLSF